MTRAEFSLLLQSIPGHYVIANTVNYETLPLLKLEQQDGIYFVTIDRNIWLFMVEPRDRVDPIIEPPKWTVWRHFCTASGRYQGMAYSERACGECGADRPNTTPLENGE